MGNSPDIVSVLMSHRLKPKCIEAVIYFYPDSTREQLKKFLLLPILSLDLGNFMGSEVGSSSHHAYYFIVVKGHVVVKN